ncbi:hypothetical protein HanRHA438_Chr04g0161801 [Helianthus annuus]|nr:hypothetical protein HanRHA438_Chr04g0161801 [Helianthus annuus]
MIRLCLLWILIKSDDTTYVVLGDAEAIEGEDVVTRTTKCMSDAGGKYVNVPNVKGFTKAGSSKPSTRRSSRRLLKGPNDSSDSELVDHSDDIEVYDEQEVEAEGKSKKGKELPLVVGKKGKSEGKKVVVSSAKGSPGKGREGSTDVNPGDVYVADWSVKRTQEYEEFSKKKDKMKDSMATLKKENESFAEKEKTLLSKVVDLTSKHEVDMKELKMHKEADKLQVKADREALDVQRKAFLEDKEGLKASLAQATSDNQWLIEHGFQQVVAYLLHSTEFNSDLGDVYTKLLNHGKHQGFVAGYKAHESRQPQEQSSFFQPQAFDVFKESVSQDGTVDLPLCG